MCYHWRCLELPAHRDNKKQTDLLLFLSLLLNSLQIMYPFWPALGGIASTGLPLILLCPSFFWAFWEAAHWPHGIVATAITVGLTSHDSSSIVIPEGRKLTICLCHFRVEVVFPSWYSSPASCGRRKKGVVENMLNLCPDFFVSKW